MNIFKRALDLLSGGRAPPDRVVRPSKAAAAWTRRQVDVALAYRRNARKRRHGGNSTPVPGGGVKERTKWAARFAEGTHGHRYVGAAA